MSETGCGQDAFNYLQEPALSHCCLAASGGMEASLWGEPRNFVLDRFNRQGIGEPIHELRGTTLGSAPGSLSNEVHFWLCTGSRTSANQLSTIVPGQISLT